MCDEILPKNVNLMLDEVESALCLPILLGMLYFTILLGIPLATSVYNTIQGYMKSGSKRSSCKSKSFVSKIKGMIGLALFPNSESDSSSPYRNPRSSDSQTWSATGQNCERYDCDDDDDDE